jgi:hypothetical protein
VIPENNDVDEIFFSVEIFLGNLKKIERKITGTALFALYFIKN